MVSKSYQVKLFCPLKCQQGSFFVSPEMHTLQAAKFVV